jgi:hypothetical protein
MQLQSLPGQTQKNIHERRYQIVTHGASHETYNVVPSKVEGDFYKAILYNTKVIEDSPWEHARCKALLRQKPVFFADCDELFEWAN